MKSFKYCPNQRVPLVKIWGMLKVVEFIYPNCKRVMDVIFYEYIRLIILCVVKYLEFFDFENFHVFFMDFAPNLDSKTDTFPIPTTFWVGGTQKTLQKIENLSNIEKSSILRHIVFIKERTRKI